MQLRLSLIPYIIWLFSCSLLSSAAVAGPLAQQLDQFVELYEAQPEQARALLSSLEPQLNQPLQPDDHSRLLAYLISEAAAQRNTTAQVELLKKADVFLDTHKQPDFQAELLAQKYFFYLNTQQKSDASNLFTEIERLAPQVEDPRVRYLTFNLLGAEYQSRNQFPESLKAFRASYDSLQNYHHPRTAMRQLFVAQSIIQLNITMQNLTEAKTLLKKAIEQGLRHEQLKAAVPDLYRLQATIEAEENNYPAAEQTLRQALELASRFPGIDTFLLQNNLGDAQLKQRKLVEALASFEKAYQIAKQHNFRPGIATAQFNKGYAMLLHGEQDAGVRLMAQMVEMAEQDQTPDFEMVSYYQELADGYRLAHQPANEADTLRKQLAVSRRVFQSERDKQISLLQESFSAQEKAREISALKQQNALKTAEIETKKLQQHVVMLFGTVLILATFLLYLLYRKVRSANTQLKQANDQLAYTSTHDPLTGLLNRRSLQDYMARRSQQGERRKTPAETDAFILLDVDFFKHINDHFGHLAGDAVLVELGRRLKRLTRADDMVLRWGGEEFLILLRHIDQTSLEQFCQRVLNCIGQTPVVSGDLHIPVTASAGFITLPFDGLTDEQLGWEKALQLADMALYLGKVHGRNRAYGFKRLLKPFDEIRPQLEQDLSQAIELQQVEMTLLLGPNAIV